MFTKSISSFFTKVSNFVFTGFGLQSGGVFSADANSYNVMIGDYESSSNSVMIIVDNSNQNITLTAPVIRFDTTTTAPTSASANGTPGTILFTSTHLYICVASNTWKRVAISTW